jgi:drug/metabolite transporter (DMT)-like permease
MDFGTTFYGLIAAVTWGAGDFSGGIATKRSSPYSVVISAHGASMVLLVIIAIFLREPIPPIIDWLWGGAAGLGGGFGLLLLYKALASGKMAVAAPISALVAAGIPVIVTGFTRGIPEPAALSGIALALLAIWLVSGGVGNKISLLGLRLPVLAGMAFSFFFLCLNQASSSSILFPLIAVRIVSISGLLLFSLLTHQQIIPSSDSLLPVLMSGMLDTIGNGAFAMASQLGRVDIAAVLSSLYPGSTVILAWFFLHERMNFSQFLGIIVALLAIVLITL